MKSISLIVGGILVAVNLLFGLLLSSYSSFNMWFITVVLILTTAFVYVVNATRISEAAKVAFSILLPLSGGIKLVLGIVSPERIEDNWCVIGCVVLTVIEIVMIVAYRKVAGN